MSYGLTKGVMSVSSPSVQRLAARTKKVRMPPMEAATPALRTAPAAHRAVDSPPGGVDSPSGGVDSPIDASRSCSTSFHVSKLADAPSFGACGVRKGRGSAPD
eukprot:1188551-Prorocentrum_minimum.AAC.2